MTNKVTIDFLRDVYCSSDESYSFFFFIVILHIRSWDEGHQEVVIKIVEQLTRKHNEQLSTRLVCGSRNLRIDKRSASDFHRSFPPSGSRPSTGTHRTELRCCWHRWFWNQHPPGVVVHNPFSRLGVVWSPHRVWSCLVACNTRPGNSRKDQRLCIVEANDRELRSIFILRSDTERYRSKYSCGWWDMNVCMYKMDHLNVNTRYLRYLWFCGKTQGQSCIVERGTCVTGRNNLGKRIMYYKL